MTIDNEGRFEVTTKQDVNMYSTTLTVHKTTLEDAGQYSVLMRNDFGEIHLTVSVIVNGGCQNVS